MPIVLLHHARVAVSEALGHHEQRYAIHDGVRGPGVPGDVKVGRRGDLPADGGFLDRTNLMRLAPRTAVGLGEDQVCPAPAGAGFKPRSGAKEPNGSSSAPKRNGKVRKQSSLAAKFNGWIEHGYFDEPRTLANVQKKFQQVGLILPKTSIPQYLLKAVRDGR